MMTSLIAACGSGRSASVIPAVPAAWSVTMIVFMEIVSWATTPSLTMTPADWKNR
jgi:hypothetical protein